MRLRVLFVRHIGDDMDGPTVFAATDDRAEDYWGGLPEWYIKERHEAAQEEGSETREAFIEVPDWEIERLFGVPVLAHGAVVEVGDG